MFKDFCIVGVFFLISCGESTQPKPKALLRLEYGTPSYDSLITNCPYWFEKNKKSFLQKQQECSIEIFYPEMKATIYITYKPVENNLKNLLRNAEKLTYEHVIKASNIIEQPYINEEHNVFGMFYEVDGNAASQSQFYVTDSTKHFLTGSIYFNAKPNFDSIQPAAFYLKNDIRKIMETIRWK